MLNQFLDGQAGLYDEMLAYQQTPEFERDLKRYWKRHKARLQESQEERRAYARVWRQYNRAKHGASAVRYKVRRNSLPNTLTDQEWQTALDYFGGCCAICGRPAGLWHKIVKGHWIPLSSSDCPGTVASNIIPICDGQDGCNQSQKGRLPTEWIRQRFGNGPKGQKITDRINAYFGGLSAREQDKQANGITSYTFILSEVKGE